MAVLAWCNAVLPTDKKHSIILVAGETGVVVGIIKERKLTNLLKVQTIEDALANVRRNADEFAWKIRRCISGTRNRRQSATTN